VINGGVVQMLDDPTFEVRGVIEFDISSLVSADVQLELSVFASNGPLPFTVDVFTYTGDGLVALSDFSAGSAFTSFVYSGESKITLDVSSVVQSLQSSGDSFAGFRFEFAVPSAIPLNAPFLAFNSLEFPPAAELVMSQPAVSVDIKPGSDPNSINPRSRGVIPVAILTTSVADGDALDFDALQVDASTVRFGPAEATITRSQGRVKDVDGDGEPDLLLHFKTRDTGIACGDTSAALTGKTFGGQSIVGTDAIQTVGCK
jgi:hypothetical protein